MPAVRDWSSMRDLSKRVLEERTGRTLAGWNRRAKTLGPKDEESLREWLAKEGVTGYGASLLVWERFGYPDFLLADADELIDAQYAKRPELRPIFDGVVEAAAGLGDVAIQARKTYVSLVTPRRTFARVQAKADRVVVGLRLDLKPRGRLKASKIHDSMPVQIELASVDELDDDALALLENAYEASR